MKNGKLSKENSIHTDLISNNYQNSNNLNHNQETFLDFLIKYSVKFS